MATINIGIYRRRVSASQGNKLYHSRAGGRYLAGSSLIHKGCDIARTSSGIGNTLSSVAELLSSNGPDLEDF